MAGVDQLAVVARQRLEAVVGGLDEDLRLVSGRAQHALDAEHLVADGVAVAERREHLVDRGSRASPGRSPSAAWRARPRPAGRSWRRRSNQPGSGSIASRRRSPSSAARTCRGTCARSPASRSGRGRTAGRCGPSVPASQRFCSIARSVSTNSRVASRSTARRCCGCTGPSARRTCRWRAPAGRAPTLRAPPSTGSRSTTA